MCVWLVLTLAHAPTIITQTPSSCRREAERRGGGGGGGGVGGDREIERGERLNEVNDKRKVQRR